MVSSFEPGWFTNIRIRPTSGYARPGEIRVVERVSKSTTVDKLLRDAWPRIPNPNATALYHNHRFIQPNMTLSTAGIDNNCILESCTNPHFSAICTSVLNDLTYIKKLPEGLRTEAHLKKRFGNVITAAKSSWTTEKIKYRIIHCATLKKHLQKNARYEHCDIPFCPDMEALCNYIQRSEELNFSLKQSFKSVTADRTRVPTLWAFFNAKLIRYRQLAFVESDPVGKLVEECAREHGNRHVDTTDICYNRPSLNPSTVSHTCSSTPERLLTPPRTSSRSRQIGSATPRSLRNSLKTYIPQYRSGAFAILCALAEPNRSHRENEKRLRYEAQKYCRASMFEGRRGGKFSAWNAYRQLQDKNLVQVEHSNVGYELNAERDLRRQLILSLVHPKGERMADSCYHFFQAIDMYYKESGFENLSAHALVADHFSLSRIQTLRQMSATSQQNLVQNNTELVLLIDTREDPEYREIMRKHCERIGVTYEERKLPVGDYLFVRRPLQHYANDAPNFNSERVQPWCIERKSWRDLATSVAESRRGISRFHCAKEGISLGDCGGKCQICKMLASGIQRSVILVEGDTCSCSQISLCHICKDHQQKNLPTLRHLEKILDRLILEYGIYIVNATTFSHSTQIITQITCMLLSVLASEVVTIPYQSLMRKAPGLKHSSTIRQNRKKAIAMTSSAFFNNICSGAFSRESLDEFGQIAIWGTKQLFKKNAKFVESIWKKSFPPYDAARKASLRNYVKKEIGSTKIPPSYLITFWNLQIQLKYGVYLRFVDEENDANTFASRWNSSILSQREHRKTASNTISVVNLVGDVENEIVDLLSNHDDLSSSILKNSTQRAAYPLSNAHPATSIVDLCETKVQVNHNTDDSLPQSTRVGDRWSCKKCTYDNPGAALNCEMCYSQRPAQLPVLSTWVCSKCTFVNSIDVSICQVCQHTKFEPNVSTKLHSTNGHISPQHQLALVRQKQKEKWMHSSSGGRKRKIINGTGAQTVGCIIQREMPRLGASSPRVLDFGSSSSPSIKRKTTPLQDKNRPAGKRQKRKCGNCGAVGHARSSKMCPMYNTPEERQRRQAMLENKIDRKERETIQAEREESMHQEVLRRHTELLRAQERLNQLQEGRLQKQRENVEKKKRGLERLKAKKARADF
eukprot:g1672.t1